MRMRLWLSVALGLGLGCWVPSAAAQWARTIDEMINRPALRGPSARTGGNLRFMGKTQPLVATRSEVALLQAQPTFFRGRGREIPYGSALAAAQVGIQSSSLTGTGGEGVGGAFNADLAYVVGLHAVTDRELRIPSVAENYLPRLDACQFTPRPPASRFDELFGLTPTQPPPTAAQPGTAAQRLEAKTDELVQQASRMGLELFKQATVEPRAFDAATGLVRYRTCADCDEKLIGAIQRLRMVRDLDSKAYLPPLLMAHAYLEQSRVALALNELLLALRREPNLLVLTGQQEPLDGYFGDAKNGHSAALAAQMRRFSATPDEQKTVAAGVVALNAYCAWRLGDMERARTAAVELERLARETPARSGHLLDLSLALQDVLRP